MPIIEEVDRGIYLVHGHNRGRFPFSHSVLVDDERRVLFDTGCGEGAIEELKRLFDIDLVVNSHTHADHFSGNGSFSGVELLAPEPFWGMLADLESLSLRLAGGGEASRQWLFLVRDILGHRPVVPTCSYRDGDVIDCGRHEFRAVHTPGHTADHYCFWEAGSGILLSFDFDLTSFGPWYGHAESDLDALRVSLSELRGLGPRTVISSHRLPVTCDIDEEFGAFEAVIDRRAEEIIGLVGEEPVTCEELADLSPIYGMRGSTFALYRYFESRMIEKHLDEGVRDGFLWKDPDGLYRKR